jgi:hypothetical protein
VERYLERRRKKENRDAIQKALTNSSNTKPSNAAPAPGKNNKRQNSRGRSQGRGGGRSKSAGRNSHSQGKKKGICYTWKNTGKCAGKDDGTCKFDHPAKSNSPSRSNSPGWQVKGGRKKSPYRGGGGKGKNGKKSRSPSRDSKSIPCFFYAQGKCSKGSDCNFSHDKPAAPGSTKGNGKGKDQNINENGGKGNVSGKNKKGQDF